MVRTTRNSRGRRASGGESRDQNQPEDNNPQENEEVNNEPELNQSNQDTGSTSQRSENLEIVKCNESLPSSDSNKENIDSNRQTSVSFDPGQFLDGIQLGEYNNTSEIPLPQLLKLNVTQLVSGFEFGEVTKRQAQENMKTARDRSKKSEVDGPSTSTTEHKTPHSRKRQRLAESKAAAASERGEFPPETRKVPECLTQYPDCKEVWKFMIFKEEAAVKLRNPRIFIDFKSVTPRMRAILLDWLMEVSAVYHLRRVTYYLSVDYFDRFLSIRPDIPKSLLQLVGITCLYIAAKVEEIYPPNLNEFSYVCDGACKSQDMVSCELLILNSLGWEVVLTTPSDWLNLYMQLHFKSKDIAKAGLSMDFNKDFIFPQYSAYQFTRASQLMDLLSLDPGFLKFSYSVIAASAMHYMYNEEIALSVSGLSWQQLEPCVRYMEVFFTIIDSSPDPRLQSCIGGPNPDTINKATTGLLKRVKNGPQNENYSFQTHVASMDYFEKATIYRLSRYARQNKVQNSPSQKGSANLKERVDGLVEDLNTLGEYTEKNNEDNLMTLDEIFELILSQDDEKK